MARLPCLAACVEFYLEKTKNSRSCRVCRRRRKYRMQVFSLSTASILLPCTVPYRAYRYLVHLLVSSACCSAAAAAAAALYLGLGESLFSLPPLLSLLVVR
jgi:hypothetical protein